MSIGLLFWVLMVLWVIFYGWGRTTGGAAYWPNYNGWLLWVLFFLVGWRIFGFILQDGR
jgi:hypothetical protein